MQTNNSPKTPQFNKIYPVDISPTSNKPKIYFTPSVLNNKKKVSPAVYAFIKEENENSPNKVYVGETYRNIYERGNEHLNKGLNNNKENSLYSDLYKAKSDSEELKRFKVAIINRDDSSSEYLEDKEDRIIEIFKNKSNYKVYNKTKGSNGTITKKEYQRRRNLMPNKEISPLPIRTKPSSHNGLRSPVKWYKTKTNNNGDTYLPLPKKVANSSGPLIYVWETADHRRKYGVTCDLVKTRLSGYFNNGNKSLNLKGAKFSLVEKIPSHIDPHEREQTYIITKKTHIDGHNKNRGGGGGYPRIKPKPKAAKQLFTTEENRKTFNIKILSNKSNKTNFQKNSNIFLNPL